MPEYKEAQEDLGRNRSALDHKSIHNAIDNVFDLSKQFNNDLDHFWIQFWEMEELIISMKKST